MAMNAKTLKEDLKPDLIRINRECEEGSGIGADEYADMLADAIASRVVEHIKASAEISTEVDGMAGPYPVKGTGKGKVS